MEPTTGKMRVSPGVLALWVGVLILGAGFVWSVLRGREALPEPPAAADPAAQTPMPPPDSAEP